MPGMRRKQSGSRVWYCDISMSGVNRDSSVTIEDTDASSAPRGAPTYLRRHRFAATLTAAALAVLVVVFVVRHRAAARDAADGGKSPVVAVAVATVVAGDIKVNIAALGQITPLATATVKTQISGQLQQIGFQEGQQVRAGDFLAQIDPRPYEAALWQMRANLQRDEALLANSKIDLKRYQGLLAEDSIAEQQLATQRALVQQYEGTVEGDRAQVNSAALNLKYTRIVSPISGRVGLRQVDIGNYVTASDANGIVVVTQLQPISALFSIPEDNVNAILRKLQAGATLDVEAFDRVGNVKLADGKLVAADNEIDPATGTFKLRALFANADGQLVANQFVNIRLFVDDLRNQIVIPNAAVRRGAPDGVASTFAYRVNADNTVAVRPVVLGAVDGERVAVTSGVAPGDVVVTEGGDRLRDGAKILLPDAVPAARPTEEQHASKKDTDKWHRPES